MLDKFLRKLGVKSYLELNDEEKDTYRQWEMALQGRRLTDGDVADFLGQELEVATDRLVAEDLSVKTEALRKAEVRLIKKIQAFLAGPEREKQLLEQQIAAKL